MVTVLPASTVPVKVGVVMLVVLSVLDEPLSLAAVRSGVDGAVGAELSRVKLTATPLKVLRALSVAVACTVYVPSASDAQVGIVTLLVQVVAALLVVAVLVAPRVAAPDCQDKPVQYRPSEARLRVKMV